MWPVAPMFHSMPPENQAPLSAKLAGWNTGFTYSSSRPVGLWTREAIRPPRAGRTVARSRSFSMTRASRDRGARSRS
ncbi:hypothetical protein STENM223S_04443 [Streptomyces tendae]